MTSLSLRSVLEKDKLNRTNFLDWYRNLRIVLKHERKAYVLDAPVPDEPKTNASGAVKSAYDKHVKDSINVSCLMLATMTPDLQKGLEFLEAYEILLSLKEMFQIQARLERFETMKALHWCKMAEGADVSDHILKMKGYIDHLDRLGFPISQPLATDMILNSLPSSYHQLVMNCEMKNMVETVLELHEMLKTAEKSNDSKPGQRLMIRQEGVHKKHASGQDGVEKFNGIPKTKGDSKGRTKSKIPEDAVCFHCSETGHWKRNCPKYLEELRKQKAGETSASGDRTFLFMITPGYEIPVVNLHFVKCTGTKEKKTIGKK